ncbi:MAG: hypothetical protein GXP22_00630 [Gammaproteobacteria bacterium]|nr:hypothetical protein [Gammaproteobacteria bacterium]
MSKLSRLTALSAALLVASPVSHAVIMNFTYTGMLSMLSPTGEFFVNTDVIGNATNGNRTDISGTLSFDTISGGGNFTITPFNFAGDSIPFSSPGAMIQSIGGGWGNPGSLMLVNLLFDWGGSTGVPVSMLWDASGFYDAINIGMVPGDQISGGQLITNSGTTYTSIASVLPASDNTVAPASGNPLVGVTPAGPYPIGLTPLAMTTYDTETIAGAGFGSLPSGGLTVVGGFLYDTVVDATNGDIGIGGSPMINGPFAGWNLNLDIGDANTMILQSIEPSPSAVPVPAAVWLFLSGIVGLFGMRKRS